MTKWERTGDTRWRDKIYAGMDSLSAMPYGFRSGRNLVYGYDPKTGKLYQVSDELGDYNLTTIQGGAEVVFELNDLIDQPAWQKTWLQYCRLQDAPADVITRDRTTGTRAPTASTAGRSRAGPGWPPTPIPDQESRLCPARDRGLFGGSAACGPGM